MAEILESYDFKSVGGPPRYPYDQWFDGQIWKLQYMVDFDCQVVSLRQGLYAAAKRRGISVKVAVSTDGDVVVQRID